MKKLLLLPALLAALAVPSLAAQEGDDFFDDGAVEVESAQTETNVDDALDKESLSLSGNIDAMAGYTFTRDFLWGNTDWDDNSLTYYLAGDFLIDARLRKGFRAFTDVSVGYTNTGLPVEHDYIIPPTSPLALILPPGTSVITFSENQTLIIGIKEIFVDFNIANAVYFRAGKQVLTWGRGYLWNPTDLINIQKKSFLDMDALREGTLGLRMDFAFDRAFHIFTFVDLQDVEDFSQTALAGKAEFLIGSVESSLSAWWKGGKLPVFGFDISAPLFWDIDFRGEVAVSWGDNQDKMRTDGTPYSIRDELVPRFCVGLSRSFDVGDVEDRVSINAEFYYNGAGYEENMLEVLSLADLSTFFLNGYYDSGNYGKYYGALFITIQKFLISQFTLTVSGMGNFSDMSFVALADLAYAPVYNFSISFRLMAFLGENNREYTMGGMTASGISNNMFGANISCSVKF